MKIEDCKPGMKVVYKETSDGVHEITAVGRAFVLLVGPSGYENTTLPKFFEPILEFPERWMNVYPPSIGVGVEHYSRTLADQRQRQVAQRIGVIHLAADGTLTMEAP